ncbi:MAG: TatD family hydrolase [Anaerolineae bacterium]|nr:TatD family hydrolase [Anaerolineae bacterium]
MLADTHCHLDFNKFDEDRDAVIQRAIEAGITRILIPALDFEYSLSAVRLAESHPNLFAAVGFHPTDVEKMESNSLESLRNLILPHPVPLPKGEGNRDIESPSPSGRGVRGEGKIVAIGEIGLDYYWVNEPEKRAFQHKALKQQLKLAQEVNKPAIIHMREENDEWFGQASIDLLEILSEWHQELSEQHHPLAEKPGVLHSYNGNLETAQKAIDLNFYIGITGPVTYKNAQEKRNIIKQLPITRLLIETDAPFLTPVPHRGKRNEPAFVSHIADKIAEVHMTTLEHVAEITSENANNLFGWGG